MSSFYFRYVIYFSTALICLILVFPGNQLHKYGSSSTTSTVSSIIQFKSNYLFCRLLSDTIRSNKGKVLVYDGDGFEYRSYHIRKDGIELFRYVFLFAHYVFIPTLIRKQNKNIYTYLFLFIYIFMIVILNGCAFTGAIRVDVRVRPSVKMDKSHDMKTTTDISRLTIRTRYV